MYLVQDKGGAVALMLASLTFLGTWPAIMNYLERRGRLLQHTYLDYSITNLLVAVVFALTLGQFGSSTAHSPNFLTQLGQALIFTGLLSVLFFTSNKQLSEFNALVQDNGPSVAFALAGGLVLSIGNLACQYGWPFVGLSVTQVVSSSITVVIGTTLNYFLDGRINRAEILFPGVGCFLVAVVLGSFLHRSNSADNIEKLKLAEKEGTGQDVEVQGSRANLERSTAQRGELPPGLAGVKAVATPDTKAATGSAAFLLELEEKRAVKAGSASYWFGLSIVFFSGLCFSLFTPAFNLASNDQWKLLKPGVPHLVVYTAFFYFSIAAFVFGFGINLLFLYRPMIGLPSSSFSAYLSDWKGRPWALLAGVLCGLGNGFQFMGGQAAGYAAADAVQALPLVSTFWGILIFGEYHRSSRKTYVLLATMLLMFVAAVAVLMSSSGHRKSS